MTNSATKLSLHQSSHSQQGIGPEPMESRPYAPRSLCETGKIYWRDYVQQLYDAGMLFSIDLTTLQDLCRWEAIKERAFSELPGPDKKLFMEYHKDGELTHVQSHAAFANLRSCQATINTLREKLGLTLRDRSGLKIARRSPSHSHSHRKNVTGWGDKNF